MKVMIRLCGLMASIPRSDLLLFLYIEQQIMISFRKKNIEVMTLFSWRHLPMSCGQGLWCPKRSPSPELFGVTMPFIRKAFSLLIGPLT